MSESSRTLCAIINRKEYNGYSYDEIANDHYYGPRISWSRSIDRAVENITHEYQGKELEYAVALPFLELIEVEAFFAEEGTLDYRKYEYICSEFIKATPFIDYLEGL